MKTKLPQRHVIISYSNLDKAAAQKVCQSMEKAGLKCWMAPRDVAPGHDYAEQIMNAISNSAAMVLVLSGASNKSPHVSREVERAVSKQIPIIPFVIEPVKLSQSMEYYVSSQHWLEAIDKPLEKHFPKLAATVKGIMTEGLRPGQARETTAEVIGAPKRSKEPAKGRKAAQPEIPGAGNADEEMSPPEGAVSPWRWLTEGRMPLVLGGHLAVTAAVWGILALTAAKLGLSPHLPNFVLAGLLLLTPVLPALMKLSSPRNKAIAAGLNLLAAAGILYLLFHGKALGTVTNTVMVTNEQGQKVRLEIPKPEFRKRLLLGYFDNESSDTTLNWLQYAIPRLVETGLDQDIYLSTITPRSYADEIIAAGFPKGVKLPLTLLQKTAQKWGWGYFATGTVNADKGGYRVALTVYRTENCATIGQSSFNGADIFILADQMAAWIKIALGLPESHLRNAKTLPVSELTTRSPEAYKYYSTARNYSFTIGNDHNQCIKLLEKAAQTDSSFAYAYLHLCDAYTAVQNTAGAERAIKNAMKYSYKLIEDDKFGAKSYYYNLFDPKQKFQLAKMWVETSPYNADARRALGWQYDSKGFPDSAIGEFKQAYELDPGKLECLKYIGWLYQKGGNYKEAAKYLRRYAEQCPENVGSFSEIASLFEDIGDFEQSRQYCNKALMLEPENIRVRLQIAGLDQVTGLFTESLEKGNQTLNICKNAKDSSDVFDYLSYYYETRGQRKKTIEALDQYLATTERGEIPFLVLVNKLFSGYRYAKAGAADKGLQILKGAGKNLGPSNQAMLDNAYIYLYLETGDTVNIARFIGKLERSISAAGREDYQIDVLYAHGRLAEMQSNYEEALDYYRQVIKKKKDDPLNNMYMGRCYRKLKDYKKAEQCLNISLQKGPFEPDYLYEMALVYADMGKKDKAVACLKRLLEAWAEADPDYKPAQKAREKLAELQNK